MQDENNTLSTYKQPDSMRKLILLVAAIVTLSACGNKYQFIDGQTQGTSYHLIMDKAPADIQTKIDSVLNYIDGTMSIFNPESTISRYNRGENVTIDGNFEVCVAYARTASIFSKGAYDITAAPLVNLWGFGPDGRPEIEPTQEQIDSVMQFVGYRSIRTMYSRLFREDNRTQIDLSSVAKGMTVDMMCKMLDKEGVENYLVEIGGEVRCKGISSTNRLWRVGIDNPDYGVKNGAPQTIATLAIPSEVSVATSGNYRNYYTTESGQRVAHTINALTGRPSQSPILSATVVAPSCARADAFATMLMVAGDPSNLQSFEHRLIQMCDFLVVYSDENGNSQVYKTKGMSKFIQE